MAELGAIRTHKDGRVFLDFGRGRRVWSLPLGDQKSRIPFDERLARRALERIRDLVSQGRTLDEAIASLLPSHAPQNLVLRRMDKWLEVKRIEMEAGDLSPNYLTTLEHYAKPNGVMSWWDGISIHEIDYAALEDWSLWLSGRRLKPKSRRNIIGVFRSFIGWMFRRGDIREMPRDIPWPRVPEHAPTVLSLRTQRVVLKAIPEEKRGIFLCMATLGLRNGEARALNVRDYSDGELMIANAVKGPRREAPIRGPKNGRWRRLPVPTRLADWIDRNVPTALCLENRPLFIHPGTGKRWAPTAMRREWHDACERAGVPHVKLYEGARHSAATEWKRQGADDRTIQAILGHTDGRSVERYARMANQAVVEVLRPKKGAE